MARAQLPARAGTSIDTRTAHSLTAAWRACVWAGVFLGNQGRAPAKARRPTAPVREKRNIKYITYAQQI